jgi:hypothetical protein
MRKIILILALVSLSNSTLAEWTKLGLTGDDFISYVDTATIRGNGSLKKIWALSDYKTAQNLDNDKYLSIRSQEEFDCKEEKKRILVATMFSSNMGKGNVIYNFDPLLLPSRWQPIAPETVGELYWKVACGILKLKDIK